MFKMLFFIGSALAVSESMQNQFKNNQLDLQSNFGGDFWVSVIGGLSSGGPPQPEAFDKIFKIVRERSQIENAPLVSVTNDLESFLPTSFLETGIKYSQAVCRIARYFSLPDFIVFIENIQSTIANQVNVNNNFDTMEEVIEVFSIPPQIVDRIFGVSDYGGGYARAPSKTPLEDLKGIKENLLAKINPIPIGTGFLVGGSHLMTNHHVIQSKEIAAQCVAQFNYVENAQGDIQKSIDYEIDPILFVTEPSLDYTLVQLKSGMFTRQAGYEFGWAQLIEDEESVKPGLKWVEFQGERQQVVSVWESNQEVIQQLRSQCYSIEKEMNAIVIWHPDGNYDQDEIKSLGVQMGYENALKNEYIKSKMGDAVIIVQHPKGKQKQIVLSNNRIIKDGLYQEVLRYEAQSNYGSSGSPVFNTHWKLVALHHAAVPRSSEISSQSQQSENDKPMAQQGIRICRIIEDLCKKSVKNSKLRSFIQDFVITAEQLNYPPLPSVARLNSSVSAQEVGYFNCGNHENLDVSEAITCEAWVTTNNDESKLIFCRKEIQERDGMLMSYGYWMGLNHGRLYVKLINAEDSFIWLITTTFILQDGLWHHIAFTWRNSQEIKLYIDGKKLETDVYDNSGIIEKIPPSGLNAPALIGYGNKDDSFSGDLAAFSGDLAEVRLWKTDRSQDQIKETMYRRLTDDHRKEGLIGYWQFEEDRASKCYVYNFAAPDGGAKLPSIDFFSPSVKIQPQFSLKSNGENSYIDCGSFAIENAITFEAWIKPTQRNRPIAIAGQGGDGESGYGLLLHGNIIEVYLQSKPLEPFVFSIANMPSDNDWHHIAFTWSSNLSICIYIDGEGFQDESPFAGPIGSSASNLCIGRYDTSRVSCFQGSIAEVRLWNVARSGEQIREAMKRPLSKDEIEDIQLLGYWPLSEEEGNEASNHAKKDSVSNQPRLVYGGTWLRSQFASQSSQGEYGVSFGDVKWLKASECSASLPLPCGLKFNGKANYWVNCGNDPSLNVKDAITVEAWVKHRFGNCLIINRGCSASDGYSLCWHEGKIRVMFYYRMITTIVDTKENAPVDQVWHHIAFTWDKNSQEVSIYVDGRLQDCVVMEGRSRSIAYAGQTRNTALFTDSLADLTNDFIIGRKTEGEEYYDVAIAEVRLWKVVRTQDQIKTSMTCRLSCRDDDWQDLLGYWRLDDGGVGNTQARNLTSDSNHGVIQGAQWFPAPPTSVSQGQPPTPTENPGRPILTD